MVKEGAVMNDDGLVWKAGVEGVQVSLTCHGGGGIKQGDARAMPYFNYSAGCNRETFC